MREYAYSALQLSTNTLKLNYIDMLVVQELNAQQRSISWQMSASKPVADYIYQTEFKLDAGEVL